MRHIAILKQPFFNMILSGEKTIESRWSQNRVAPYNKIKTGDEILIKLTGKEVTVRAYAGKVEFYELTPELVEAIRVKWGKQIGTDKLEDWQSTLSKKFCTLIWLENVQKIEPMKVNRSNGAGWICLNK